ncbi:MAG TPA: SCP2 sterol-binding domain-containing protein [Actinomycetota bacterium]|nr:SCP2 sterol-binding domain-containing protein [Actinomycetota bacterium]
MSAERVYLWEQTRGKSDQEIMELVNILGKPAVFLEVVMAILPLELDRSHARDCVIGFEISADEKVHYWRVEIAGDDVICEQRDPTGADATIAVSLPNFVRLVCEELGGVKAFMQGKLWVRGDPTFAYSIPRMFPFREKAGVA